LIIPVSVTVVPIDPVWDHFIIHISVTVVPISSVRASRIAVFSRGICRGLNG